MRKGALITTYLGCLSFVLFLNSCQDDPIVPNGTGGNGVDTTWTDPNDNPDDGLNHDGTCPYGDGCDICDPTDDGTFTDPNDPNDDPYGNGCGDCDSTFGDPFGDDPFGDDPFGGEPCDSLGGGN